MATNLNDTLKAGIELYTGRTVKELERFDDPKVSGAYAIRATMEGGEKLDFLIRADWQLSHKKLTPEIVDKFLEDAVFTTWPPTVGKPKFVGNIF